MNRDDVKQARVLVVGDVMLDRYWEGPTRRISPEAPVPIVAVNGGFEVPGGAANVAVNIAALGATATLVAFVGEDNDAFSLAQGLEARGIRHHMVVCKGARTIVKLRVMSQHQQLLRLDFEDGFANQHHGALLEAFSSLLDAHDLVICSDYGKGTLAHVEALIAAAKAKGLPVLVDPKGTDFRRYAGADVMTPNMSEFVAVAGSPSSEEDFAGRAVQLREEIGVENLLVTRSEKGMSLFAPDGSHAHFPAQAADVFDVTGAGDTAIAVLAVGLACGLAMGPSIRLANKAAGIVVGRRGTASVTYDELFGEITGEVSAEAEVLASIQAAQKRGQRIVMTNGCFDILHAGHVSYLNQARMLGDKLVVAVNTDDSVSRLKGPTRPMNSLANRMAVLASLKAVDYVVPFDGSTDAQGVWSDTPLDIILKVHPDVLVKGADYEIKDIVGAKEVLAWGGDVQRISFVDGLSTTALIAKMKG